MISEKLRKQAFNLDEPEKIELIEMLLKSLEDLSPETKDFHQHHQAVKEWKIKSMTPEDVSTRYKR